MYIMGPKGDQWVVDEGLGERAAKLQGQFDDLIGHVVLDQVIFMRLTGSKAKWHGICYYVGKNPIPIISKYVAYKLNQFGLLDLTGASFDLDDMDIFDIRFIIVLNDESIGEAMGDVSAVEDITLVHEMMHIHPDGDKLVSHDLNDFGTLVNKFGPYWGNGIFSQNGEEELSRLIDSDDQTTSIPDFMPVSGHSDSDPEESD